MKAAINIIREATYSFSQSSIQSNRTIDENFIYEGSFQPIADDPFWLGHLRKFQVNEDGSVGAALWDAGEVLKNTAASGRNIKTLKAGSLVDFNTAAITKEDLAVATDADRDMVVGYIRGDAAYNPDNWKLGDVFRSTPITVGTPSIYYEDNRDSSSPTAFKQHRDGHPRTSANGLRVVTVGANDGQLHAFKTSDGSEAWSFIAPNLLPRLRLIAHTTPGRSCNSARGTPVSISAATSPVGSMCSTAPQGAANHTPSDAIRMSANPSGRSNGNLTSA